MRTRPGPPLYCYQYLLGRTTLVGCFVGSSTSTHRTLSDEIRQAHSKKYRRSPPFTAALGGAARDPSSHTHTEREPLSMVRGVIPQPAPTHKQKYQRNLCDSLDSVGSIR